MIALREYFIKYFPGPMAVIFTAVWLLSTGCGGGNANNSPQIANPIPSPVPGTTPATGTPPSGAPSSHSVTLTWDPSTSQVLGYNVYRSDQPGGPYARINPLLLTTMSFVDSAVSTGQHYWYVATSVGLDDAESQPSAQVEAIIPSP